MKKINNLIIVIIITTLLSSCNSSIATVLLNNNNLTAEIVSSKNFSYGKKSWEVEFNSTIDRKSISKENSYIEKSNGTKIDTTIEFSNADKNLIISPTEDYVKWETYTLVIEEGVKSTDKEEKVLEKPLKYKFDMNEILFKACTIENFEEFKPTGVANNNEELYNEVKYALATNKESLELKTGKDVDMYSLGGMIDYLTYNLPLMMYMSRYRCESVEKKEDTSLITFSYIEKPREIKKWKQEVMKKADEILSKIIKPGMKDWEKEKAIHDYLCSNTTYKMNYSFGKLCTAYNTLINKEAQCQGTAHATYLLMNKAGIPCVYVTGSAGGGHAWNLVKLDGKYYHIDCTWDNEETLKGDKLVSYKNFNVTDSTLSGTHDWNKEYYPVADSSEYSTEKLGIVDKETERKMKISQTVKNEKEFKEKVKSAIKNKKEHVVLKVDKYDSKLYSVDGAVNYATEALKWDESISWEYEDSGSLRKNQEEYIEIYFTY